MNDSESIKIAAAILAGGKARRFNGIYKGNIRNPDGIPIIKTILSALQHADIHDLVIVTSETAPYSHYPCPKIPDLRAHIGPLGGIEAALTYFKDKFSATLFLPCDTPNISAEEIAQLRDHFLANPNVPVWYAVTAQRNDHPLIAIVRNDALPCLTQLIDKGERKVLSAWQAMGGKPLRFARKEAFVNINSPAELDQWLRTTR